MFAAERLLFEAEQKLHRDNPTLRLKKTKSQKGKKKHSSTPAAHSALHPDLHRAPLCPLPAPLTIVPTTTTTATTTVMPQHSSLLSNKNKSQRSVAPHKMPSSTSSGPSKISHHSTPASASSKRVLGRRPQASRPSLQADQLRPGMINDSSARNSSGSLKLPGYEFYHVKLDVNDNNENAPLFPKSERKIEVHSRLKEALAGTVSKDRGSRSSVRKVAILSRSESIPKMAYIDDWKKSIDSNVNRSAEDIEKRQKIANQAKHQKESTDILARSRWRRDPIKERLLFLTGHASHEVSDQEYVNHLDKILLDKHNEKERQTIHDLAELERDREWLWSVKYDNDFTAMEMASLNHRRKERADAAEYKLNKQDAMFCGAGKDALYTVAARTQGLDKMRNIKELRRTHEENIDNLIQAGLAHPRRTWLPQATELEDAALRRLLAAEVISDVYRESDTVIKDTMTLQEQEEEEGYAL